MHPVRSFFQATRDIRILWGSVFFRMAGYGLTNQVLTLHLEALGISESNIGLFMSLTLVGDTMISYFLTWNADRIGRKRVMMFGTLLMFTSGFTFAFSSNFLVLLTAAILGVISPSGDETGPFKSVEEASIAHLTPENHRPEVYAFYGVFATAGAAFGSLICGFLVDYMNASVGFPIEKCYRIIFLVYTGISIIKFILVCFLSPKCEIHNHDMDNIASEENSLLEAVEQDTTKLNFVSLSDRTFYLLPRLLAIFMLDSLGYGFMTSTWIVYYLKKTFEATATGLGLLFFLTNTVNSISSLPSAYLAKLLGPVRAILFTQAPSGAFFIVVAFLSNFYSASFFLLLYYITTSMDVVPRQILLTSLMPREELTKVMGIVNIGKTFARCIGPIFTGKFAAHGVLHYGFIINGGCVLLADLILATNFLHVDAEILHKQSIDAGFD